MEELALLDFLLLYIGGLNVAFTPCLFPVLPTFITYVAGRKASRIRAFWASFLFSLGLMTSFVGYSLAGVYARELVMPLLTGLSLETAVSTFGFLLVGLGLSMFTPLREITARLPALSPGLKRGSIIDAYILGLFFSLLAAPCAAGLLLAIIAKASLLPASEHALGLAAAMLQSVVFSLGASTPFLILGALTQEVSRRIHKRLVGSFLVRRNEDIMGVLLMIYGIAALLSLGDFTPFVRSASQNLLVMARILWASLLLYFSLAALRFSASIGQRSLLTASIGGITKSVLLYINLLDEAALNIGFKGLYQFAALDFASSMLLALGLLAPLLAARSSPLAGNFKPTFLAVLLGQFISPSATMLLDLVVFIEACAYSAATRDGSTSWLAFAFVPWMLEPLRVLVSSGVPHEALRLALPFLTFTSSFGFYPLSHKLSTKASILGSLLRGSHTP